MGHLWCEGKREVVTEWKIVFVQQKFYWLLGNIWRWDVSILAPCILCYEVWLFQMAVWLWNMGCQRRRGLGGERNYKDMAIVIRTQCYFHVAAFYWPFGHWDKWAVKWLGIYWQTLVTIKSVAPYGDVPFVYHDKICRIYLTLLTEVGELYEAY